MNEEIDIKKIYLDVSSLDELREKYKGANIEELARKKLEEVRKNPVLFQEENKKYFWIEEIADFILIHNENKIKSTNKAVQTFTRRNQAKEFGKLQPYFYDKSGLWWLWNTIEYKWERVDGIDILNMISENTNEDTISSKNKIEILNALMQEGRKKIPKKIKPTWIQFKDLIVDIETGEEFEATPEYFVTNPIPHPLNKERYVNTPVMDKIFEEWVGKDYVKTLYEILAYCLLPSYPLNRLFCLIGSGMNGKSKFLDLLRSYIGETNCCSTELDTLLNSRFEVTKLHKKLVCQMGETNFNEMSKTSMLKKLTGGDLIGFEYKNKDPFNEKNYAKILIATNSLPTTSDKTIGFYRRWLIIDFPNQFSEKKDILKDIPIEEYEILGVKLLGILKDLLDEKKFHNEGEIEDRMKKYEEKSDFLGKFCELFIEQDPNGYITSKDFHVKFNSWCKENKHREMSDTSLALKLKKKGFEKEKRYFNWLFDGKGGQLRVWSGIKWKMEEN